MNRIVKILLICIMLIFAICSTGALAQASENTENSSVESTISAGTKKKKTGWQKSGKYRYYYTSKGKMATGWKKISGKYYYFHKKKTGSVPKGSAATGFCVIGKKTFYFSNKGVLQTGWNTIGEYNYYFKKNGAAGTVGMMATGFQKISGGRFFFEKDGRAFVGWKTYKKNKYFFSNSTKLGTRGRALTGWKTIGKQRYYFNKNGIMQKNCWISKKYYLDSDGRMMTSAITPDGYIVNAKGEKTKTAEGWIKSRDKFYYYVKGKALTGWKMIGGSKYYFDTSGVRQDGWITLAGAQYYLKEGKMQTGWKKVDGKFYYFGSNGKMAVNTTVDGIALGADGIAVKEPEIAGTRILLIAGHGQGDVGAIGKYSKSTYYEYQYTREFANLIYKNIKSSDSNISVEMYDRNYDCYQVLSGKKDGPIPILTDYDYILEIHFNATVEASKDPKGDGAFKGVGMYVNAGKKNMTLDKNIVKAIAGTGFKIWGGGTGVYKSETLFNAKTCQEEGVAYSLLETAFIDDRDDMKFYNANKSKMAKAAANAIVAYYN